MSKTTPGLPPALLACLQVGAPALLLTISEDGYPNLAYTWAAAPDATHVRFGADHGSVTLANLQRDNRAALEIVAPGNLVFMIKGAARPIKNRIAAAPFRIALMELIVAEVKDQSWPGVTVSPLDYEWPAEQREAMLKMEQAVYAELRTVEAVE